MTESCLYLVSVARQSVFQRKLRFMVYFCTIDWEELEEMRPQVDEAR
jgi:hypothetical protein